MIPFLNSITSFSEQLNFLLGLLFLVMLLVALWQGVALNLYKKMNQRLSFDLVRSKLLMESTEGVWCAWGQIWGKPITFFHSKYFCEFFNMNPGSLFELSPVFDILQEDSQKKLQTKISLLHTDHIPFQIELVMLDLKKMFGKGYYFDEEGMFLNIIWFRATDLIQEEEQRALVHDAFRLKNLMDILPFPTWIRDEQLHIIYVNKAYASLLEVTPETAVRKSMEIPSWIDKQDPYKLSKEVLQSAQPQKKRFFTIIQGNRHVMEVCEFPQAYAGIHGGYAVDLTQEENLRENFKRYKQVEKNVLDSFFNTAVAIFDSDTRIRTYNHAYLTLVKSDENFLNNHPTMGEVLDDLRERRQLPEIIDYKEYRSVRIDLFNTLTGPVEEIQHRPDGKILRVVQTPHPLGGIIMTLEDVTSYLKLESDLRVMLAVYRESIDHLYEGILLFGTDNRVILTNPALGVLWGLSNEQRKSGAHVTHLIEAIKNLLILPQNWEDYKNHILDNMSDRVPKVRQLYLTNDNIYQLSYIPLPDGSNLVIFLDITRQEVERGSLLDLESSIIPTRS